MNAQNMAGAFMGLGMVTSLLSGIGQYGAGQQEKAADEYNAEITLQNMRAKMLASQQQYTTLIGRQASAYARAGVDIASGSPLLIMAATAARGGQQAAEIEQAGTEEAALQRYYGKIAAWRGTFGGIGTFLKGVGTSAMQYGTMMGNIPTPSAGSSGGGP